MAGRCVVLELCPYSGVSRGLITVASQSVSRVVGQRRAIVPHSPHSVIYRLQWQHNHVTGGRQATVRQLQSTQCHTNQQYRVTLHYTNMEIRSENCDL